MKDLELFSIWLPVPELSTGAEEVAYTLQRLLPILRRWTDAPDELIEELHPLSEIDLRPADFGIQPSRGSITQFPLFCALWAQPNTIEEEEPGRWAQAALVLAVWLLSRLSVDLVLRHSAMARAGLTVRRILSREYTPILYWSLPEPRSLAAYADSLDALLSESLPDREIKLVRGLLTLTTDALRDRPARLRSGSQRTGSSAQVRSLGREVDDPASPNVLFQERRWQSRQQRLEAAAGVAEIATTQLIAIKGAQGEERLSPGQQIRRARYRAEAIALAGQGVMQAPDRLQLVDLAGLDQAAKAFLDRPAWLPQAISHQAVAAVFLSLLSGRTIAELHDTQFVGLDFFPHVGPPLIFAVKSPSLNFAVPKLPKSFEPDSGDGELYRSMYDRYSLQLPAVRFVDAASACVDESMSEQLWHPRGCYPLRNIPHLQSQADKFLEHVNNQFNVRTTSARIAGFLKRQAYVISGDRADADLLSSQRGTLDPRLYYYTPHMAHLNEIYQQVWAGIQRGVEPRVKHRSVPVEPWHLDVRIGSQGTPLDEAVRQMAQLQMQICRKARTGRPGPDRLRKAHNALTSYTLLLIMWHTGVRAVDDPVDLTQYDPSSGYLGVSDKDGDDYADARVVWLPEVAQKQIDAYRRCVQALYRVRPLDFQWDGSLFYLSPQWTPEGLAAKNIRRRLKQYRFRLNSQRHYLRTRLRELNVPGQSVDALLGHGLRGHEPYAEFSAYAPAQLQKDVAPALEQLSKMAGWAVIPAA